MRYSPISTRRGLGAARGMRAGSHMYPNSPPDLVATALVIVWSQGACVFPRGAARKRASPSIPMRRALGFSTGIPHHSGVNCVLNLRFKRTFTHK